MITFPIGFDAKTAAHSAVKFVSSKAKITTHDAEDIAQDCYLAMIEAVPRINPFASQKEAYAWLCGAARYAAQSWLRRKLSKFNEIPQSEESLDLLESITATVESIVEARMLVADLIRHLGDRRDPNRPADLAKCGRYIRKTHSPSHKDTTEVLNWIATS